MHKDDSLIVHDFQRRFVLWLRVDSVEHPFDSTGHFPVLAGYDTSGRDIFVAQAYFSAPIGRSSAMFAMGHAVCQSFAGMVRGE